VGVLGFFGFLDGIADIPQKLQESPEKRAHGEKAEETGSVEGNEEKGCLMKTQHTFNPLKRLKRAKSIATCSNRSKKGASSMSKKGTSWRFKNRGEEGGEGGRFSKKR